MVERTNKEHLTKVDIALLMSDILLDLSDLVNGERKRTKKRLYENKFLSKQE